jgi:hypothetical protein
MGEEVKADGDFLGGVRKSGGDKIVGTNPKTAASSQEEESEHRLWESGPRLKPSKPSEDDRRWAEWSAEVRKTAKMIRTTLYVTWFVAIMIGIGLMLKYAAEFARRS